MPRAKATNRQRTLRATLRRRVRRLYASFNRQAWARCLALIDPALHAAHKVDAAVYEASLRRFHDAYGVIDPWHLNISLHLEGAKRDPRPFAFVYLVWQDRDRAFHMFRERWVLDGGRWYTRVVGLVANEGETPADIST